MSKLPQFDTLDELVEFWETHDFTDYLDEVEEVDLGPLPIESTVLRIPLEAEPLAKLAQLAAEQGLTPTRLVRSWIEERLKQAA
ncbi:MAG: BrnA antitoxin family protein [Anaerolineae bacterium]|nr:BrnA antitoxin family protein [Anaerolineae bacterium]